MYDAFSTVWRRRSTGWCQQNNGYLFSKKSLGAVGILIYHPHLYPQWQNSIYIESEENPSASLGAHDHLLLSFSFSLPLSHRIFHPLTGPQHLMQPIIPPLFLWLQELVDRCPLLCQHASLIHKQPFPPISILLSCLGGGKRNIKAVINPQRTFQELPGIIRNDFIRSHQRQHYSWTKKRFFIIIWQWPPQTVQALQCRKTSWEIFHVRS